MDALDVYVDGIGFWTPGVPDWPSLRRVLEGGEAVAANANAKPSPNRLPPTERRRAPEPVLLASEAAGQACAMAGSDVSALACVFTSTHGDLAITDAMCATLAADPRELSPTRFHNSVHNAAAGYWSIAYGCAEPSTALCAHDASFGAGLLEAAALLATGANAVLLIAYDADYPPPLRAVRRIPDAFGIALVLVANDADNLARLQLELTAAAPGTMNDRALEALRVSIPAARSLPLLECVAGRKGGTVILDYLNDTRLAVRVEV